LKNNDVDGGALQEWLLFHKGSSARLWRVVAAFSSWLANKDIPWAAIQDMRFSRLLGLEKPSKTTVLPGSVHPIQVGDIISRCVTKVVLHVTKCEATEVAGAETSFAPASLAVFTARFTPTVS